MGLFLLELCNRLTSQIYFDVWYWFLFHTFQYHNIYNTISKENSTYSYYFKNVFFSSYQKFSNPKFYFLKLPYAHQNVIAWCVGSIINPFIPTVPTFAVRETDVSRTANVGTWLRKRNGGQKWVNRVSMTTRGSIFSYGNTPDPCKIYIGICICIHLHIPIYIYTTDSPIHRPP